MKGKPNIDAFLEGAESKKAAPPKPSKPAKVSPTAEPAGRITKTIRLATDIERTIKELAYQRWQASGKRVTESDIIDEALRSYLKI